MRSSAQSAGWIGTAAIVSFALSFAAMAQAPRTATVEQRDRTFVPDALRIAPGTEVVFTNADPYVHHVFVDAAGFAFDSGEQRPGQVFRARFDRSGSYVVRCAIHLKMRLAVTVQ